MSSVATDPAALACAALGAVVVSGTLMSMINMLLLPRGRVDPLLRQVDRAIDVGLRAVLRLAGDDYYRRDRLLAVQAPVVLLAQLLAWMIAFVIGFALLLVPATGRSVHALREAASSLLTLGMTASHGLWATAVDAAAALTGLVVVALLISYLPTLYAAFNRRETEVTLLSGRAGVPAWGPELLARTKYGIEGVDLAGFWTGWERWAADIAESHTSHPVIMRFRSPTPLTHWVVSLLAVLDAAALQASVAPSTTPVQVRLTLRMGFLCLRRLAATAGLPVEDDPRPDSPLQLTYADFEQGYERLLTVGYRVERTAEEAWPHFRGWRVNYESSAYALARQLDAVPAPWSGPRRGGLATIGVKRPLNRTPTQPGGAVPAIRHPDGLGLPE